MKTILIVDDDVCIGDMLQEVLAKEGYRTARAYSGTEALLYLSRSRPDLILLDLMLPGLSGEELLPLIEDIPVIVVSAKSETSDKVELLLGGRRRLYYQALRHSRAARPHRSTAQEALCRDIRPAHLQRDPPRHFLAYGGGGRAAGPPDEDRICHPQAADAESLPGDHQVCHAGPDQRRYAGLC